MTRLSKSKKLFADICQSDQTRLFQPVQSSTPHEGFKQRNKAFSQVSRAETSYKALKQG